MLMGAGLLACVGSRGDLPDARNGPASDHRQASRKSPPHVGSLALTAVWVLLAACGGAGSEQPAEGGQAAEQVDPGQAASPQTERIAARAEQTASARQIDWGAVEAALGRSGSMQPGAVFKFSMPRTDLSVTSAGVQIAPALALGSWLAFKERGEGETVAMGDLVLTEQEYSRVIARLQEGGVAQTAVHKHLLEMSPAIWWTHVHGEGDPVEIARTVRGALELTGTPPGDEPGAEALAEPTPGTLALDTAEISRILGYAGNVSGGVYHVSVARAETIRASGLEVPASMGTATALNFQPTGDGRAVINGDFVMTTDEVQGVIRALEQSGITVVALHNHMLTEEPRLFFLHFWANDDATELASGLRAALDQMNVQPR